MGVAKATTASGRIARVLAVGGVLAATMPWAAEPARADATVFVPKAVAGRTTVIDVWCGAGATAASVNMVPAGGPPELPMSPYPAGGPGAFRVTYQVPADTRPDRYDLAVECDNGEAGRADLLVGSPPPVRPADTTAGRDPGLTLLTSLAVVVGLVTGGVALARRYAGRVRLRA